MQNMERTGKNLPNGQEKQSQNIRLTIIIIGQEDTHWPSSARLLSPVVKEYQDESFIRQMLVVDTFVSDPTIFEEVINVAASLLMADQKGLGLMDLCFMSKQVEVIPAGPGRPIFDQSTK